MAEKKTTPKKARQTAGSPRSMRIPDELWAQATERAEAEDYSMNAVILELVEGYANGKIALPKIVKVYPGETLEKTAE